MLLTDSTMQSTFWTLSFTLQAHYHDLSVWAVRPAPSPFPTQEHLGSGVSGRMTNGQNTRSSCFRERKLPVSWNVCHDLFNIYKLVRHFHILVFPQIFWKIFRINVASCDVRLGIFLWLLGFCLLEFLLSPALFLSFSLLLGVHTEHYPFSAVWHSQQNLVCKDFQTFWLWFHSLNQYYSFFHQLEKIYLVSDM